MSTTTTTIPAAMDVDICCFTVPYPPGMRLAQGDSLRREAIPCPAWEREHSHTTRHCPDTTRGLFHVRADEARRHDKRAARLAANTIVVRVGIGFQLPVILVERPDGRRPLLCLGVLVTE